MDAPSPDIAPSAILTEASLDQVDVLVRTRSHSHKAWRRLFSIHTDSQEKTGHPKRAIDNWLGVTRNRINTTYSGEAPFVPNCETFFPWI